MSRPQKTIYVTFQQEGTHLYPEAATAPELASVQFLGHPHRHIFHVKVWLEVKHDNRDVEFIIFKRELQKEFSDGNFDSKSCEMICDDIAHYIQFKYPGRWIAVDVAEDGENGSYAEYDCLGSGYGPMPKLPFGATGMISSRSDDTDLWADYDGHLAPGEHGRPYDDTEAAREAFQNIVDFMSDTSQVHRKNAVGFVDAATKQQDVMVVTFNGRDVKGTNLIFDIK